MDPIWHGWAKAEQGQTHRGGSLSIEHLKLIHVRAMCPALHLRPVPFLGSSRLVGNAFRSPLAED